MSRALLLPSVAMAALITASCSLAPDLHMPSFNLPEAFKESDVKLEPVADGSWKLGAPAESIDRGEWWKIFKDEKLDQLEEQAAKANQTLAAAAARVEKARAIAGIQKAPLFPQVQAGFGPVRTEPSGTSLGLPDGSGPGKPATIYNGNVGVSYEVDLFRRIGDSAKAAKLDAESADATYKSLLLALQADVASNYYTLLELNAEHDLLKDTLASRVENQRIIQKRFDEGDVSEQDLARAQTDLSLVQSNFLDVERRQTETQHALALLLGQMPSEFTLEAGALADVPPVVPAGIPSALLERRPDITAAQKTLAAANARIGVAKAAFFPSLTLTASGGYESNELRNLFNWSSRTWALGPLLGTALTLPVFEGGRNKAQLAAAKADYTETVADYRQQVLVAFKDVEDNLARIRFYTAEAATQETAVTAAVKASHLSDVRYAEGYVSHLEVVDSQRTALAAQQAFLQIKLDQYVSTIDLIRALGGNWQ